MNLRSSQVSLKLLAVEHVASVFLNTDHFAETCHRLVSGDEGDVRTITGIPGDDMAMEDDARGRGYTHRRSFDFAESSTLLPTDAIKISGTRYEIDSITDAVLGMRTANLVRYQPEQKGGKPIRQGGV